MIPAAPCACCGAIQDGPDRVVTHSLRVCRFERPGHPEDTFTIEATPAGEREAAEPGQAARTR